MREWQIVKIKCRSERLKQVLEMFDNGEFTAREARDFAAQIPDDCMYFMPGWYSKGTIFMLIAHPDLFIFRARQMVKLIDAYVDSAVAAQKAKT